VLSAPASDAHGECCDQKGGNRKRIAVRRREGHELADDTKECLAYLNRAGCPAHLGKEQQGYGILRVESDVNIEDAVRLLRICGFQVMEFARVPSSNN
jgi:hypothetical protein